MKTFFDFERFHSIDESAFREQKPFPFLNPTALLSAEGWAELEAELPAIELFEEKFGKKRYGGQMPHDRYSLEYTDQIAPRISSAWRTFIEELRSDRYRSKVRELLGVPHVGFRFHWHYTPTGRGVSPHIDQHREYGSHIFYFNAPDWTDQWGGQTVILGSEKFLERKSAPSNKDFESRIETCPIGNRSLIFSGRKQGWHAVQPITCPETHMRRVFIVVFNTTGFLWRVRDRLIGKKVQEF